MSETSKDTEETVRLAVQAAEAANEAATDIGRIREEYVDAADLLTTMRQNFSRLAIGLIVASLFAVVAGGLVFFRTLAEMRASNATQVEALTVFAETVKDLKISISQVEDVSQTLTTNVEEQRNAIEGIDSRMRAIEADLTAKIAELGTEADGLQPQIAKIIKDEFSQSLETMRNDMLEAVADLQLALSKMIAASFETSVKMQEQANLRAAQAAAPRRQQTARAPKPTPRPRKTPRRAPPKPAPKPPANPFSFP